MDFDFQPVLLSLERMLRGFIGRLPYLVVALIVFFAFQLAAKGVRRLVRRMVERRRQPLSAAIAFGRILQAGIVFLGLLVALVIAIPSFQPGQLVQFLGIGTVAIGFAFRDVLQNFLAGILLLVTEPFRIGDQIKYESYEGVVEDIQTRATMLRTYDGRRIVIPNANLFTNSFTVNTAFERRRLEQEIGIGYGDDIERARAVILQTLGSLDGVLRDPPPDALVVGLASSSVTIRVRWWFTPPHKAEEIYSRDLVLTAVKTALLREGIDLPYDVRTVLFHDQTDEFDGDRSRQREGWPARAQEAPRPMSLSRGIRDFLQRADSTRSDPGRMPDSPQNG